MSTRIVRLKAKYWSGSEVDAAFDAAPDEATLPTILWCVVHECEAAWCRANLTSPDVVRGAQPRTCRVVRVPLPVHLGVEVTDAPAGP